MDFENNIQTELFPRALINGAPLLQLPEDLYIPPEALEVFLETFEGPLDLLLYLIRKDNINILDIPIARITEQYIEYIHLMKSLKLELAADYLVMAAMLAEIKSQLLLPKPPSATGEEEQDPRAELVRRLQLYEQMKTATEELSKLPQLNREIFWVGVPYDRTQTTQALPIIALDELISAMQQILMRCHLRKHHEIKFEAISVRARMADMLTTLQHQKRLAFSACFTVHEGRPGLVASFIALLELLKSGFIIILQPEPFAEIMLEWVEQDCQAGVVA